MKAREMASIFTFQVLFWGCVFALLAACVLFADWATERLDRHCTEVKP